MEIARKQEKLKFCKDAKVFHHLSFFIYFLHTTDAISIELIQSNPSYTPKMKLSSA